MPEFTTYTHLQRPELESHLATFGKLWPEFMLHDEIARIHTQDLGYVLLHLSHAGKTGISAEEQQQVGRAQ